ncbi:MAG: DGQHR domain-containing protein [Burkholderiaceae bacterium]
MLDNVFQRDALGSLARANSKPFHSQSLNNKLVPDVVATGWTVVKAGNWTSRLTKPKARSTLLEHRVWTMLYRMGLPYLSGDGGGSLLLQDPLNSRVKNQLDVVAIDDELAMAFECKAADKLTRRPLFQEELAKHASFRERFIRAVNSNETWKSGGKRIAVLAFFLENIILSENDRERAKEANVLLFDDGDLDYYEKLVNHIGPAARYQFYADAVPGRIIPGLTIRVPAVKTKMGGHNCYTFPISPEYLLKIAYVSHRARGKASDIHAYQRMMAKSRLAKIRDYIYDDGIFPTNIVLNIEKKFINFQRVKQENTEEEQNASGSLGWLEIRPAYKSAWVIDGQHRLFAYSGHPRAAKSHLSVLSFEGLSPSIQAGLFVDINAKQKSVKQSLLQELDAELHWESDRVADRVRAVVSKVVQVLDADKGSPLYGRVLTADVQKDSSRCISFTSLYRAIAKPRLYVVKESKGEVLEYGPLWGGDNDRTLKRTSRSIKSWLTPIRDAAPDWWELGSADGGGLTMNDGITACLNVLDSVLEHVEKSSGPLVTRDDGDLCSLIEPYAVTLGAHLGSMSAEKRKSFRDLRGVQGQTYRTRQLQIALRTKYPSFDPPGLDDFFKRESEQTNLKAKISIDHIEQMAQSIIIQELRQNFKATRESWWLDGVPKQVRLTVSQRGEQDDKRRGSMEAYFDLMDYRKIVVDQWQIFQNILGYGKKSESKDRQTKWFVEVNDWRNVVAHPSSGKTVSLEELAKLVMYETWLKGRQQGTEGIVESSENESAE